MKRYSARSFAVRCVMLVLGLFVVALGVALSAKANLGISPVSCLPFVLSELFPFTMGQLTIMLHVCLILLQIILLRKKYQWVQLTQLLLAVIFGYFIDFATLLLTNVQISAYPFRLIACIASCVLIGFGVFLEVKAALVVLAAEGLANALVQVTGKDFGKMKVTVDVSLVTISIVISLVSFGALRGVREGTIISAFTVGFISRFFSKRLSGIDALLSDGRKGAEQPAPAPAHSDIIVTIGREFGSGGHLIGEKLAQRLSVPFYDRQLISQAAEQSGLSHDYVAKNEEKMTHSLLYDLVMQNYAYTEDMAPADALFKAQSDVIRQMAAEGGCVIVGRCASEVLSDNPHCFRIFVRADKEARLRRIVEDYGISSVDAPELLRKVDNQRSSYFKRYIGTSWGHADGYHICIDSSLMDIDSLVDQLLEVIAKWRANLPTAA